MVKQIIIVRKDLNMRKGKIASQVAHASMAVFFDRIKSTTKNTIEIGEVSPDMMEWATGSFAKIVVGVNSLEELLEAYKRARQADLPTSLIVDSGATEFHGKDTPTAVAVGPAKSSQIDKITKDFKLL